MSSYGLDTYFAMCAQWPRHWRYDFDLRSWHTLGPLTTIVCNIIQIQHGSEELWPWHGFWLCVHSDLDLGDMTLVWGHDTPLGHVQQLCKILSRSDMGVKGYGLDTMWTDRQTEWFLYTLWNFVCGVWVYNYQLVRLKSKVNVYGRRQWCQGYDNNSLNIYFPAN